MSDAAISVHGVGKRYRPWVGLKPTSTTEHLAAARQRLLRRPGPWRRREIWALRDVSFDIRRGEILGVLGRNGAGKSTLLSVLAGITEPTEGYASVQGRVSALIGVGTGFHDELTGRENVFLNGVFLGMPRAEVARKFDAIVDFSEIDEFIDVPVKRYSSGMRARLAFSVAAHVEPDILLVDEVISVGDPEFREKCHERMTRMAERGLTGMVVTHDRNAVKRLCQRALVMDRGRVAFFGDAHEAVAIAAEASGTRRGDDEAVREALSPVRFANVWVGSADHSVALYPDQPFEIHFELEADEPTAGKRLGVQILITDSKGRPLTSLSTSFDPSNPLREIDEFERISLTCELDELPVRAGRYLLSLRLFRSGELLDELRDLEFEISANDFFGEFVPPESFPALLVSHRWRLADRGNTRSFVSASRR